MVSLLIVCTGNICRSPFSERLLQQELDEIQADAFSVRSAGTQALVGHDIDASSKKRLQAKGVDSANFEAQQVNAKLLEDQDFVLTMTEVHRTTVVNMAPRILKRAFTVREFSAIIEQLLADKELSFPTGQTADARAARWELLRKFSPLKRHATRNLLGRELDIADPYRRGEAAFDAMESDLVPLLEAITRFESYYSFPN